MCQSGTGQQVATLHVSGMVVVVLVMCGEQYRSLSSSICSLLHSPVTPSVLGSNVSPALYSRTPSVYILRWMRDTKFYTHTKQQANQTCIREEIKNGLISELPAVMSPWILSSCLLFNPLPPNDVHIRRTAQLTSRRCVWNIYSTNILTEYFKHAAHSLFFSLFKMPFIS